MDSVQRFKGKSRWREIWLLVVLQQSPFGPQAQKVPSSPRSIASAFNNAEKNPRISLGISNIFWTSSFDSLRDHKRIYFCADVFQHSSRCRKELPRKNNESWDWFSSLLNQTNWGWAEMMVSRHVWKPTFQFSQVRASVFCWSEHPATPTGLCSRCVEMLLMSSSPGTWSDASHAWTAPLPAKLLALLFSSRSGRPAAGRVGLRSQTRMCYQVWPANGTG